MVHVRDEEGKHMIDLETATSRELEAYLRETVRKSLGNEVEDGAKIVSSHGSYTVTFKIGDEPYEFKFRRKSAKKIAKAIRSLKA